MTENTIQIVIKAPNQRISDQTIECELSWSILQLKTHLSNVYPTSPKIEEQKLIYGGHMLLDNLTLKDVLRHENGQKHTLHLVCALSNLANSPSHSFQNSDNEVNTTSQQGTSGTSLHYRGTRQNGENFANISHTSAPQFQMPPAGAQPNNAEMMAQQMAAMQQFYAQYMAQIMQNAQMGVGTYPNFAFSPAMTAGTGTIPPGFSQAPQIAETPNVPRANVNPAAPAPNPNIRMNAQGGAVMDEDEDDVENRDWLDWFYIICRAVILFSVVYFYSSLGRFMVVFGLSILIYLYQGGWFGPRQGQQNQEANRLAVPNPNEPVQGREDEQPENEVTSPNEPQNEAQIEEELREIQQLMDSDLEPHHTARPEPSPLQLFWQSFTTFFTSMIPEQPPPPVNIN